MLLHGEGLCLTTHDSIGDEFEVVSIGFQPRLTLLLHQQTVCVFLSDVLQHQQRFHGVVDGANAVHIGNTQVLENAGPANCVAGDVVKSRHIRINSEDNIKILIVCRGRGRGRSSLEDEVKGTLVELEVALTKGVRFLKSVEMNEFLRIDDGIGKVFAD